MRLGRLLLAAACAVVVAHVSAVAQARGGGGSSNPRPITPPLGGTLPPTHTTMGDGNAFMTTRTALGVVREVNYEDGYIVVADPKRGVGKFYLNDKTRLRADKDTPLGDRKKLSLEDFQKGQTVKVTFWPLNFKATEVRVRQPKS